MFIEPDDLEIEDSVESVGVGVVPKEDTAAGTPDLEWTLPTSEFEAVLDEHDDRIDCVATFSTEAEEFRPERLCTQDLFVLFVDSVEEFEDEIIPDQVPEPEEGTEDTPSSREVVLFPLKRLPRMWFQTTLQVLAVVAMTIAAPFDILYRSYEILRERHTE